ncbi:hypothetical protein LEP1GSC191_3633 [Leptospira borgpetersenii serovar Mini str. 201000851]|uniref:Uncharacterized protein n=1 Tax=Leptospira borgpetersenii str. 200801926 TaxID=1193009 RepID=A0ABN0HZV8_LEPBO|nr:hypothetical protein LEP1GSC128_1933 [Leptospira borgpetersenii str. 200801926]EMK09268.1 hypothetical protein LEP1GSC066_3036 [Leptospira sp. serovar Kenya str. Sh9]ENO63129.1 hypothetical protein LEP1GSC191_3633 [Leptospira borgpetersenii serovar Mini str. 201000851]
MLVSSPEGAPFLSYKLSQKYLRTIGIGVLRKNKIFLR